MTHLDRGIFLGSWAEREREDDEVGAPGHALRVVREIGIVLSGNNPGHCRAVREFTAVLIGRVWKKLLDDSLVPKLEMVGVNSAIQHADGDAFSGCDVGSEL